MSLGMAYKLDTNLHPGASGQTSTQTFDAGSMLLGSGDNCDVGESCVVANTEIDIPNVGDWTVSAVLNRLR